MMLPDDGGTGMEYRDLKILVGIGLSLLISIFFFIKAMRARRRERLDRRLRIFVSSGTEAVSGKAALPARIDFEKLEKEAPGRQEKSQQRGRFDTPSRQQRLYRRLIRAGFDPRRMERPYKIVRLLSFALGALLAAALLERQIPGGATTTAAVLIIAAGAAAGAVVPRLLLNMR
ncbi:MAG: hypothetical protein WD969_11095, partial [Paracoccaceae bacterium]